MDEAALAMIRDCLLITLKIAAPIMAAGVLIGLVVSIAQSVTSIQDQTIAFVPKIVGMVVVAAILLPWVAQRLIEYTAEMLALH